jgi:hypothetical protein
MAGGALTNQSTLVCPHMAPVQITTSNTRVRFGGAYAVTMADVFTVSGCPFQIPAVPPIPSPCVLVQWLVPDTRVRVNGSFTLSQSSAGICLSAAGIPQGPPVVQATQTRVKTL